MARVEITVQAVKKTTPYAKEELLLTSNHHNQNDAGSVSFKAHCSKVTERHMSDGTVHLEMHFSTEYGPMVVIMGKPLCNTMLKYI
jgi:hypothetical protein